MAATGALSWTDHLGRPRLQARPTVPADPGAVLERLDRALCAGRQAETAALVVEWLARGEPTYALGRWLAEWIGARSGGLVDPAFGMLVDCVRAAPGFEGLRQAVPWTVAACLAGERLGGRPPVPEPPLPIGQVAATPAVRFDEVRAAARARDGEATEALLLRAAAAGDELATLEGWLLRLVAECPGDAGYLAVAACKLADLRSAVGDAGLVPLYARLARAVAERAEHLAYTQGHARRMEPLRPRLATLAAAADPDKAKLFAEPKFRAHLVDGKADAAWRATLKAVEVGLPPELLAGSVSLAAAERLLRFDGRHDEDDSVREGWPDAMHLLVLASAVRQLQRRMPAADWLPLLLFAAGLVHAAAVLDAPERERPALPEPEAVHQTWDHGPEIAKIVAHLQAGRGERAIAVLRAYFLMVLPEQPLCRQLVEAAMADRADDPRQAAQAIALMTAAVDELNALGQHPHRELPACAALRALAAPQSGRRSCRLALAAIDGRSSDWQPRELVGAGAG